MKRLKCFLFKNYRKIFRIVITVIMIVLFVSQTGRAAEITSNDVFATAELTDRTLEILIKARAIEKIEEIKIMEKGLKSMHVYQMLVAVTDMMIELEKKENIRPMPKIVATPSEYIPEDVKLVADILLNETHRILYTLKIYDYPQYNDSFSDKTPTDVFGKLISIFAKLNILVGKEKIRPTDVFQQMIRITSDVKSILSHIDPGQRFRIDSPVSPRVLTPTDVFRKCLQIRKEINLLRKHFKMEVIPVPEIDENQQFNPADVFIQTQIIIAELNLLKMGTGTISSTPLVIPVSEKIPSDVHQQAAMIEYLLKQVKPLQKIINEIGK